MNGTYFKCKLCKCELLLLGTYLSIPQHNPMVRSHFIFQHELLNDEITNWFDWGHYNFDNYIDISENT